MAHMRWLLVPFGLLVAAMGFSGPGPDGPAAHGQPLITRWTG